MLPHDEHFCESFNHESRCEEKWPDPMHGLAREPGQALIGAALSGVSPVPLVFWPLFPAAFFLYAFPGIGVIME